MEQHADNQHALNQARCVHVRESDATEDFLYARKDVNSGWSSYKRICRVRHMWGIYLRSSLDWDWDTVNYLEHLFELPEEVVTGTVETPPTTTI